MKHASSTPSGAGVSRRTLLAGAGAGALAAAAVRAPGTARAADDDAPQRARSVDVDVAVIGAGLTGLTAARALRRAGRSVHVVEADDRVGGRVWTAAGVGGTPVNWGATFVGPQQKRILALASELGVRTYPTFNTGKNVQFFDGQRKTYTGTVPALDLLTLLDTQRLMTYLDQTAAKLDPAAPWTFDAVADADRQTFWSWSRANTWLPGTRKLLDLAILSLFSVESHEISLLHVLFYIRSAGSLEALLNTDGGAQEQQFTGGTQQISEKLAAQLGDGNVSLNAPARQVHVDGDRAVVEADGVRVRARRVIVALPPALVTRIAFAPGLSALKDQHLQHWAMGSVGKAVAIYDTPFWRATGLTGQATSDTGPLKVTFDISPGSGRPGVIMGFIDGQDAREFATWSEAERRARCLDQFALYFGDAARSPRQFLAVVWDAEIWHRGCPVSVPSTGATIGYRDAWRRPEGPLHFASTETATEWSGYMDGAVQAGGAVAAEVLAAL